MSAQARRRTAVRTPGEHLRAEMQRLGFDQGTLAQALGVSRQSVNNIVTDRLPISRAMAGKLARVTGRSSDYWLQEAFTLHGPTARAARPSGILVRQQILRAVEDGIVGIAPFDSARVRAASLDLTLDSIVTSAGKSIDLNAARGYRLKRGELIVARARETIHLPLDYIARLGASGRGASSFLMPLQQLQIEPGFKGRVQFSLFNAGRDEVTLHPGDEIVCIEIIALAAPA